MIATSKPNTQSKSSKNSRKNELRAILGELLGTELNLTELAKLNRQVHEICRSRSRE